MAEGLLRNQYGDRFDVYSAGTKPGTVREEAIEALGEIGIDISSHRSKHVEEFTEEEIDFVLTVCGNAKEDCPYFPARTRIVHHAFDDPATITGDYGKRIEAFRKVRDEIREFLPGFVQSL